jgi:hypothetical protein
VAETRRLGSFPLGAICARILCFFLAEVQEDFVVGEERRLGIFYLGVLGKVTCMACRCWEKKWTKDMHSAGQIVNENDESSIQYGY